MSIRFTNVNGVKIAYEVVGRGPPLVLIMGYRLNSTAWPATFIEQLARQFTVVTLDNRGTGRSDKPVAGYAIANLARDVRQVLDELELSEVHLLGYSMGGAIAQEFVRQFPDRVKGLILCATMAGGLGATYAESSVVSVMRDLDGLSPEQAARRIWQVTYAPGYLEKHRAFAEEQMRREIALPTPLHAADLQFQAFAEFDCSHQLSAIRKPTLVLTGDLDRLISPRNSEKMASLIPRAKLIFVPGCGHRVMWEATDECVAHICAFLGGVDGGIDTTATVSAADTPATLLNTFASTPQWLAGWSSALTGVALESLSMARQSIMVGSASRFGDGKPVVLVPHYLGGELTLLPFSLWLKALGYRPVIPRIFFNPGDPASDRVLSHSIHEITERVGRKAVVVAHWSGRAQAQRAAETLSERVSDVIVVGGARLSQSSNSARIHFIDLDWTALQAIVELPRLLRTIDLQLVGVPSSGTREVGRSPLYEGASL